MPSHEMSPRRTVTRRSVLVGLGGAASLGLVPGAATRLLAAEERPRTILVVLEMAGGNDGLSTVVPHGDDEYYRLRRTTALKPGEVLPVGDGLGLHPRLVPLHRLWREGDLGIVLGVGYPQPNRSHFKSMDIWQAADPAGRRVGTGWLGRALDHGGDALDAGPEGAVNVGEELPFALAARTNQAISFRRAEAYRWIGREKEQAAFEALNAATAGDHVLPWLHRKGADALASSVRVRRAVGRYRPGAEYPRRGTLGRDLSLVAALIAGGLPTRIYTVKTGGFDTHTGQRARHDRLMEDLGAASAAFFDDLKAHGAADRVALVTFSEFGRRPKENGSGGTDHGTAGPCFVLGPGVTGGLYGRQPSLDHLDGNGDLVFTTDFRSLYATVLDRWLGVDPSPVLGKRYPTLGLFA